MLTLGVILCLLATGGNDTARMRPWLIERMPRYGWLRVETSKDHYTVSKDAIHGVDSFGFSSGEVIAGLGKHQLFASDTNVLYDTPSDSVFSYLVSLRLSPTLTRDTLYRIARSSGGDWIHSHNVLLASDKHSVVAYCQGRYPKDYDLTILRIKSRDSAELLFHWKRIEGSPSVSLDFDQILFANGDPQNALNVAVGIIMLYDLMKDSLQTVEGVNGKNLSPGRYSSSDPIVYRKEIDGLCGLWAYTTDRGEYPLTVSIRKQNIWWFNLHPDHIEVWVQDLKNTFTEHEGFRVPKANLTDIHAEAVKLIPLDSIFKLWDKALADSTKVDSTMSKD